MQKKILFVCLGNICRSPMAEGVMLRLLQERGIGNIVVDSAGILNYHEGELADGRMRTHASGRGYNLTHRSRPVRIDDFYEFDMIIGMDERNIADLKDRAPSVEEENKIYTMSDFAVNKVFDHVPDPYYGGSAGFENVIDILEDSCVGLLDFIMRGQE